MLSVMQNHYLADNQAHTAAEYCGCCSDTICRQGFATVPDASPGVHGDTHSGQANVKFDSRIGFCSSCILSYIHDIAFHDCVRVAVQSGWCASAEH